MALVEAAAQFAGEVLKPGGSCSLAKVIFKGGTEGALLAGAEARLRDGEAREARREPLGLGWSS